MMWSGGRPKLGDNEQRAESKSWRKFDARGGERECEGVKHISKQTQLAKIEEGK
jgi:hypothetical protein